MPPLKAQLLLEESLSAYFPKWCSQIPESLFNFTGIRISSRWKPHYRYREMETGHLQSSISIAQGHHDLEQPVPD